ncbi:T9SS type A sorting domain-containing protein [Seonamhaeicola aphaedonensis]|uniref:Putative secreted protein (Por secretion system target) n=1 Tax=Seonamhaeicola aphaedonensis TaxID=1461338 RepID=A0A3D9HIS2_9FLAO|nr:T9SS type A sorting domain-containing protein [Seonamhaeicola aphaedonensis]RED49348.1 putative secreted protein (Por secretion system target) [Seonamhaeicola aphaedonensis]
MRKFYRISLVLALCLYAFNVLGQDHSLIQRIPFDLQIQLSDAIIEGEVISKVSYLDEIQNSIYTVNTIKVYKVFKGETISDVVEIITPGGVIGMQALVVSHSLNLGKGDIGVFMLENTNTSQNIQSQLSDSKSKYRSFGATQGFYKYDLRTNKAVNPFSITNNIEENFHKKITLESGQSIKELSAFSLREYSNSEASLSKTTTVSKSSVLAPAITSFSATDHSAGTKSVLTINGSGFGTTKGTVGFSNANYGGALHTNALDNQVLSWSDTQIEVEIPDEAGTGTFMVNTESNGSIESSINLTVDYAQINLSYDIGSGEEDFQTQHIDLNGTGGMTWTINEDFYSSNAQVPFEQAMDTWTCESGINWNVGSTTPSATLDPSDGVNLITFGSLSLGTLGYTFSSYSACYQDGAIKWYVTDIDIIFNNNINWNFGSGPPQSGEIDFESVAVHELGHAHQLGHAIDSNVIMHYSLSSGEMVRALSTEDMAGANGIQYRSSNEPICGQSVMAQTACSEGSLSTNEHILDENISIYPNPVASQLYIKKKGGIQINTISIYNIQGRKVHTAKSNKTLETIHVSKFTPGLYILELETEFGSKSEKIIIK